MTFEEAKAQATQLLAQIGEHQLAIEGLRPQLDALKGYMAGFQAAATAPADQKEPPPPPPPPQ